MALVSQDAKGETVVLLAAFRCRACGHLEHRGHAGQCAVPHACRVCGEGVKWNRGIATTAPDNWEILADLTAEQLAVYGLTPTDVEKHTGNVVPAGTLLAPAQKREMQDGVGVKDA